MTDDVDTAMNAVKPPELQAPIDRVFTQTQRHQLAPPDNPVLPPSQLGHKRIRATSPQFPAHMAG